MSRIIKDTNKTSGQNLAVKCIQASRNCLAIARQEKFVDISLLKKAANYSIKAIEFEPQQVDAYILLAYLAALTGRYSEALDIISQAEELSPGENSTRELKADILKLSKKGGTIQSIQKEQQRSAGKKVVQGDPVAKPTQAFKMDLLDDQTLLQQNKAGEPAKKAPVTKTFNKNLKKPSTQPAVEGFTLFNFD